MRYLFVSVLVMALPLGPQQEKNALLVLIWSVLQLTVLVQPQLAM